MQIFRKIDNNGFFLEDVILGDDAPITADLIAVECPGGFIHPRWMDEQWIEGGTKPVPTLAEQRAAIQAEIDALEAGTYLTRGARELNLRLLEKEAAEQAEAQGTAVATVLAANPYYVKLKALDEQVAALRSQLN